MLTGVQLPRQRSSRGRSEIPWRGDMAKSGVATSSTCPMAAAGCPGVLSPWQLHEQLHRHSSHAKQSKTFKLPQNRHPSVAKRLRLDVQPMWSQLFAGGDTAFRANLLSIPAKDTSGDEDADTPGARHMPSPGFPHTGRSIARS